MFLPLNLNHSTTEHWTERLTYFISFWSKDLLSGHQTHTIFHKIKRPSTKEIYQHRTSLVSLHFAQNYPSNVSKTLQSWCRALKVFYQTSLPPSCNVFCNVYERSLNLLETDNISSASKHAINSSVSILKWMYIDNVSKQICGDNNWIIPFSLMKPKNCAFHISFNKASWCKNMITCKCRRLSIFPYQDIFSIPMLFLAHHYLVCLLDGIDAQGRTWCFLYVTQCPHTVYHLPAKVACAVW